MRRGSALLMALWILITLSVIVLSFAFEARLQGGVNVYVESKNRVRRLVDAGRILGEVVLLNYTDAKAWSEDEDLKAELEEDRWFQEKQALKYGGACTVGPILLDEENPDSGTVEVEITLSSSDSLSGINVNTLCKEKDANFEDRWRIILDLCGVPRDEIQTEEGRSVNLQSYIIACWQDWRDEDDVTYRVADTTTATGYQSESSSEVEAYEDYYDRHKADFADEDRFKPANGEIGDLKELARLLCFREFPAVLTGGALFPEESSSRARSDEARAATIPRGLIDMGILGVTGDGRVNVNRATREQLLTVPGIFDIDEIDENEKSESLLIADAIIACRTRQPRNYDVPEDRTQWGYGEFTSDWWGDLVQRVSDEFDIEIPSDAKNYLSASPGATEGTLFKMRITASLMDLTYTAECECYVKDKSVRYVLWREL